MKHISKLLLVGVLLAMLSVLVTTVGAQEEGDYETGEGDPIIFPNLGNDISTLNPILSADGSSNAVIARIFPSLIGVSADTLNYARGVPASLATDWEISDDGLVYTITLREDWSWSDGTPITSADVKYAYDAIASGETNTALTYILDDVAAVDAVDDYTLEVTLTEPKCSALGNVATIPVVPAHVYSEEFPTFADMNESDFNLSVQPATAESWLFRNFRPGEQVTLVADPNYPDAYLGTVVPEGWVYRNVATTNLIVEEFLVGNLTYLTSAPSERKDEVRALGDAGEIQVYEAPASTIRFLSFNLADPENPQDGLDENGEAIDQGNHPILGDVRVRQAMMHAVDWEELNQAVFGGEGIQVASHVLPTSWAYDPDIPFYEFDQELADELMTEAGWVDDDDDPSTPRVAQGALYAEDGTPMELEYITNAGNDEQEAMGLLLQDQWGSVGIGIDFNPIDFAVAVETFQAQTYDMLGVFWGFGFPDDPDGAKVVFAPENDVVGGGFNTTSYNNPEWNELMAQANDPAQTDGCDRETRAELYSEAYSILRDDTPWFWISTSIVVSAAQGDVENFDPRPGISFWNEDAWVIGLEEAAR